LLDTTQKNSISKHTMLQAICNKQIHVLSNIKHEDQREEYRTRSLLQKWRKEYLDIVKTNNSLVAADH
jgi:hypothetical protein